MLESRSGQYGSDNSKFWGTYVTTILKIPVWAMKTGKKVFLKTFHFWGVLRLFEAKSPNLSIKRDFSPLWLFFG